MPAIISKPAVNLASLLVGQINAEADEMIEQNKKTMKNRRGYSKRIGMDAHAQIVLYEIKVRIPVGDKGDSLLCKTNVDDKTLQFTTVGKLDSGLVIVLGCEDGVPSFSVDYQHISQLVSREVKDVLEIKVDDPILLKNPVTLLLQRKGESADNVTFFGDTLGWDADELTGEFTRRDMRRTQFMINCFAALINTILRA
jgi:hypothetical protein